MIPTVLIAGILIGLLPFRFAVASVVPVSAGWAVVLLANRTIAGVGDALEAAGLGFANAAVGALVGQAFRAEMQLTREG